MHQESPLPTTELATVTGGIARCIPNPRANPQPPCNPADPFCRAQLRNGGFWSWFRQVQGNQFFAQRNHWRHHQR